MRANPAAHLTAAGARNPEQTLGQLTPALTGDSFRLTQMLKIVRSVATVLSSMHWALIELPAGSLATGDHPVIAWPLDAGKRRAVTANDLRLGVLNTLEIFVPLDPGLALLMSWHDRKSASAPLAGAAHHAATVNAFVIANAAEQWFHEPAGHPAAARGPRLALSRELLDGYDAAEARASDRRALARTLASAEAARPISNQDVEVVGEDRLPG